MGQKAKNGGTLGKAPIGYLNIRDNSLGREIRTVTVDPERAPYVKLAFRLYATGEFSLQRLADDLRDRGLRTRPTARWAAGPVSTSKLQSMLRDRYYLGVVTYAGVDYPGRHEPLIERGEFEAVQHVLDAHATAGERMRRHHHYLKGTLWCALCHARGTESRMILQRTVGRHGGEYYYFFCIARQKGLCDGSYIPVERP